MKERIIVFGGTGNVGQVIIKKWVNNKHSVVVLTRRKKPSRASNDVILTASFKDHSIQEGFIRHSNFDWTIVRPTEIIPGEEGGTFTVNRPTYKSKFQISNSDVAQFIVTELTDDKFIRQVVMITD